MQRWFLVFCIHREDLEYLEVKNIMKSSNTKKRENHSKKNPQHLNQQFYTIFGMFRCQSAMGMSDSIRYCT